MQSHTYHLTEARGTGVQVMYQPSQSCTLQPDQGSSDEDRAVAEGIPSVQGTSHRGNEGAGMGGTRHTVPCMHCYLQ